MPIDVLMPALSPSMEKGTLLQWLKRVGDPVKVGDVLLEVETDKATMDVEATTAGTLTSILVPQGTADVPVNQRVGVILGEDEAADGRDAQDDRTEVADESSGRRTPDGSRADMRAPGIAELLASPRQADGEDRLFASPIARRLIREAGLDARTLVGSGPHGRILERDVKAAASSRIASAPTETPVPRAIIGAASASPVASSDGRAVRDFFRPGRFDEVPHSAMRQTIARRLTEAKQTVPHFYLAADCRVDALLKLRGEINTAGAACRISVNDLLIKALALALVAVPEANVSYAEGTMLRHRHADIAVAVAIDGGLVTPVIADAEAKSLSRISTEMKDLSERARERRLRPEEYSGGTAGLSNLGMYGVRDFTAIINPPQATMLALGAAVKRMIVLDDDMPAVATMLTATLSVDHRAVDGAVAARLLSTFKAFVETPLSMLVS